mgnify:CR=1 FL=1
MIYSSHSTTKWPGLDRALHFQQEDNVKKVVLGVLAVAVLIGLGGCWIIGPTGTVLGVVVDATTGFGLADVSVSVDGVAFASATTDSSGEFQIELPAGDQVLVFSLDGYDFDPVTVEVTSGEETVVSSGSIIANPEIVGDGIRFVLTWGEEPSDLDSHLVTPSSLHIYYANSSPSGAGAYLDVDDTTSYGPETITITDQESGTYGYYVYNFSNTPEITTSGAVVRIYDEGGLVETVSIPTTGSGFFWNVATLNGASLTIVNRIEASAPY